MSRSSTEAEYRGLAIVASELVWVAQLLNDLQLDHQNPDVIYCDNQAEISIASTPTFHERTKHIEIDCHFFCDKVLDGFIKLFPVRSHSQLADMFTKALPTPLLTHFLSKLGILQT